MVDRKSATDTRTSFGQTLGANYNELSKDQKKQWVLFQDSQITIKARLDAALKILSDCGFVNTKQLMDMRLNQSKTKPQTLDKLTRQNWFLLAHLVKVVCTELDFSQKPQTFLDTLSGLKAELPLMLVLIVVPLYVWAINSATVGV